MKVYIKLCKKNKQNVDGFNDNIKIIYELIPFISY